MGPVQKNQSTSSSWRLPPLSPRWRPPSPGRRWSSWLEQLLAAQATALRLTVLEGLSLRQTVSRLEISSMSEQRAQKKALAALRQQLVAGA